ncbi:MAG: hypothetical protein ACPGOV_02760 [Magnetovibrionaceae bacterium]
MALNSRRRQNWASAAEPAFFSPFALVLIAGLVAIFFWQAASMRAAAGPFHVWHTLDASYYYLFDALNIANGFAPGHIAHPGLTTQLYGAFLLALLGEAGSPEAVLGNPEATLRLMSSGILLLVALAYLIALVSAWGSVRRLWAVILIGLTPFISMVSLKMIWHVKPEPFLVLVMLLAAGLILPGLRDPGFFRRKGFALGLGLLSGLLVATKLTAAPLLLAFLIIVPGVLNRFLLMGASLVAGALVAWPVWPVAGELVEYALRVLLHASAHGGGAATVIDWDRYPNAFVGLIRRPVVLLPILLGFATSLWAWWRFAQGRDVHTGALRVAFAGALALLVMVAFVAKQPVAYYMVPAFGLGLLTLVAVTRLIASFGWGGDGLRRTMSGLLSLGFLVLVGVQGGAAAKQRVEDANAAREALAHHDGRFEACRAVFVYGASDPRYALLLASRLTGDHFADLVEARVGAETLWLDDYYPFEDDAVRRAGGLGNLETAFSATPCLVLEGFPWRSGLKTLWAPVHGDREPDGDCSTAVTRVQTFGVDCTGRPIPISPK